MGIRVNTNISSLNARRHLGRVSSRLQRNYERLSSGLRINSARDDAAGLAISEKFSTQIRAMGAAVRNANDATSLLQTAEGALEETTNLIQRIRELSVQAANDAYTTEERNTIQSEVKQLVEEVDRISTATTFNERRMLDGSLNASHFHVGPNARESITFRIPNMGAGTLGSQVRITGTEIDPTLPIGDDEFYINELQIRHTVAADDKFSTAFSSGSAIAKAKAINSSSSFTKVEALVGETIYVGDSPEGGTLDDINNITINDSLFAGFQIEAADATETLVEAINAQYEDTGILASIDQDLNIRLTAYDGRNIEVATSTASAAQITGFNGGLPNTQVTGGRLTLLSRDLVEIGLDEFGVDDAVGFGNGIATLLIGPSRDNALDTIDVTTREGANRAIDITDAALSQVSDTRAHLGAVYNRLQSTINYLGVGQLNLSEAYSRIVDTDFASETADFARNTILQQAGVAVLAQANTNPSVALNLLSVRIPA
jgi:flagellin